MIWLIGPGGAGKSSAGALVAHHLGLPFRDLDVRFAERCGGIDEYIAARGYEGYARANVEVGLSLLADARPAVVALSSGFMTYPPGVHPAYLTLRREVEGSPTTFVLLPSVDLEACVAETVRRQLARPFGRRGAAREEAVIRERFPIYAAMPAHKVETMRPPADVAAAIVARLSAGAAVPAQLPPIELDCEGAASPEA
jgi:shikimate kinase